MDIIGIIGGSGVYQLSKNAQKKELEGIGYFVEQLDNKKLVFVPRHGLKHQYLASEVPHTKNFDVLKKENVKAILAFSSVGCLDPKIEIKKGVFVLPHDYIRGFSSRIDFLNLKTHPDMSEPFDEKLRIKVAEAIKDNGYLVFNEGIYIYSGGNCFETKSEISLLNTLAKLSSMEKRLVVGLTAVPEAILAKENKIPYVLVCVPVNYGTGMAENPTHEQTLKMIKENEEPIKKIISSFCQKF